MTSLPIMTKAELKHFLFHFYEKFNANKLKTIEYIIEKYRGDEELLIKELSAKYAASILDIQHIFDIVIENNCCVSIMNDFECTKSIRSLTKDGFETSDVSADDIIQSSPLFESIEDSSSASSDCSSSQYIENSCAIGIPHASIDLSIVNTNPEMISPASFGNNHLVNVTVEEDGSSPQRLTIAALQSELAAAKKEVHRLKLLHEESLQVMSQVLASSSPLEMKRIAREYLHEKSAPNLRTNICVIYISDFELSHSRFGTFL